MKRVIMVLAISLFAFGCKAQDEVMSFVDIYYVPIGSETYIPVTTDNIVELAVKSGRLDGKHAQKLLDIINKKAKPGEFDSGYVRVKLVLSGGDVIYLDNNGGLIYDSKKMSLDSKALVKVKKLIESKLMN